jgi:predicted negative regulator of RcsB-dependent stress response
MTNMTGAFDSLAAKYQREVNDLEDENVRMTHLLGEMIAAMQKADQQLDYGQCDTAQDILRAAITMATNA